MPDAVERFVEAAAAVGFTPEVRTMMESTHTAEEAAVAVGCEVGAIVKSLVFMANGEPLLLLVSGVHRVDTERLGIEIGATITKADARGVKEYTGYSIGGVPPFGHSMALRTLIDPELLSFENVWAAAGSSMAVFRIDPDALIELSHGELVFLSEGSAM